MDFCGQLVKYGMFFSNLIIFVSVLGGSVDPRTGF